MHSEVQNPLNSPKSRVQELISGRRIVLRKDMIVKKEGKHLPLKVRKDRSLVIERRISLDWPRAEFPAVSPKARENAVSFLKTMS